MAKVVKIDNRIKIYLDDADYEKWSRVYEIVNMGRMMTSNIVECINDYYKSAALANIYEVLMVLMPDKKDWSAPEFVLEEIILPPRHKRMVGRTRKRRKKNSDEKISTNTNHCGEEACQFAYHCKHPMMTKTKMGCQERRGGRMCSWSDLVWIVHGR
ncbi:hypothetical protein H5410_020153 [Solanum commersonii]|uniref:Uncharacterized protein n=1 Tax=Solanum commersonii TaxID=4109 RepID=A0A9J5ZAD6_SOLCO|nr:hypothetical protein H5410_020153 [Solanum commersonii]